MSDTHTLPPQKSPFDLEYFFALKHILLGLKVQECAATIPAPSWARTVPSLPSSHLEHFSLLFHPRSAPVTQRRAYLFQWVRASEWWQQASKATMLGQNMLAHFQQYAAHSAGASQQRIGPLEWLSAPLSYC